MKNIKTRNQHYGSIDGLRCIACIGIVMMHILANNSYALNGFIFDTVIPSFTNFTFLFMVISSFGLCCGYKDRILNGTISLSSFYKKRYVKVLPFFTILVLLDLVMGFSMDSLQEAIADITLTHGLFPNNITVIGVGWFLGLIFAFYMIFPFFCVITETKKKTWFFFVVSLVLNYICKNYFGLERENIVFSSCFFIAGALIHHYKEELENIRWYYSVTFMFISVLLYFFIGSSSFMCLLVSTTMLVYAISSKGVLLDNKVFHFISGISMEIYLSHMVIFRVIQKIHLNSIFGNGIIQYLFTVGIVFVGTIVFSYCVQKVLNNLLYRLLEVKN